MKSVTGKKSEKKNVPIQKTEKDDKGQVSCEKVSVH